MNNLPEEEGEAKKAHFNLGVMRGIQILIVLLGAYLGLFEGRGWGSFFVGVGIAIFIQAKLLKR